MRYYTLDDIMTLRPCHSRDKLEIYMDGRKKISLAGILNSKASDVDKIWLVVRLMDRTKAVEFAQWCADAAERATAYAYAAAAARYADAEATADAADAAAAAYTAAAAHAAAAARADAAAAARYAYAHAAAAAKYAAAAHAAERRKQVNKLRELI